MPDTIRSDVIGPAGRIKVLLVSFSKCLGGGDWVGRWAKQRMVAPAGFEPATLCLEGRCSIQLSYGAGF